MASKPQQMVKCTICLSKLKLEECKALPCTHPHCDKCLNEFYKKQKVLKCGICRQVFNTTPDKLPTADQMKQIDKSIPCGVCTKSGVNDIPALVYCLVCSKLFCAKHVIVHDNLSEEHSRINMTEYKARAAKLEKRMCETHADVEYSLGCKVCLKLLCTHCVPTAGVCVNGKSQHTLLTLKNLTMQLVEVSELKTRENNLSGYYKQIAESIDEFRTETKNLLVLLRKQRDDQIAAIQQKYDELEKELVEKREKTESQAVNFMVEEVGVRYLELYDYSEGIEAKLDQSHEVDIIKSYRDMKKEIYRLLTEEVPKLLELDVVTSLEVKEQKRDAEVELTKERTASIIPEQGLVLSPPPPKSIELINSVEVSPRCRAVHTYKGITYAGCGEGVDRIDENNKVTESFISLKDSRVRSITVHNDRIYTLSSDSTVRVYSLKGKSITSWAHKDKSKWINQLVIKNNHIAIPDKLKKHLVFYSLNGKVAKIFSCPLLTDTLVRLCAADNNSIIISQYDSSLVYKVDISSGDIIWQCKDVAKPREVTCYRDEFVLVADDTIPTSFCVLSLHAGRLLTRISTKFSDIPDLQLTGSILVLPFYFPIGQVQFYQLKWK